MLTFVTRKRKPHSINHKKLSKNEKNEFRRRNAQRTGLFDG